MGEKEKKNPRIPAWKVEEIKKANDCALQHIKIFREQAIRKETADFGEPCQNCIHVKDCNLDWLSILYPLIERSCVEISVVDRG